ncbi:DNA-processing protein DprA [Formosa sp. A9]|uniref:DNA-processing protein DprA n=1 Tax=Formosa sp. A9 TaxID=3442641 RepID=UPI003EB8B19F
MKNTYIIALLQLPKIGPVLANKIIKSIPFQIRSSEDLNSALIAAQSRLKRIPEFSKEVIDEAVRNAEDISLKAKHLDIHVISIYDENYPKQFLEILNPPVVIYVQGNLNTLKQKRLLAVIGAREPSKFGLEAGYNITKHCLKQGAVIVSGLAQGCDTMAHTCALENNGKTIAVLPCGLDKIFPKQNRTLAQQILEQDGVLLSEYPPGTAVQKNYFIQRNRLQSALSDGVIIIESEIEGGTMHTFKFAKALQQPIGVLHHPLEYRTIKSAGNTAILEANQGIKLDSSNAINDFISMTFDQPMRTLTAVESEQD